MSRVKVTAPKKGPSYPLSRKDYVALVRKRHRYVKVLWCIPEARSYLLPSLLTALLGVVLPLLENHRRRRSHQCFLNSRCRRADRQGGCKLEEGHDGECLYDWDAVTERYREELGEALK